jgi:hypothetical protein
MALQRLLPDKFQGQGLRELVRLVEAVAVTAQGAQPVRVPAEFHPEPADVDVDRPVAGEVAGVPDGVHQLAPAERHPATLLQIREQVELAPGEQHELSVDGEGAADEVELQIGDRKDLRGRSFGLEFGSGFEPQLRADGGAASGRREIAGRLHLDGHPGDHRRRNRPDQIFDCAGQSMQVRHGPGGLDRVRPGTIVPFRQLQPDNQARPASSDRGWQGSQVHPSSQAPVSSSIKLIDQVNLESAKETS